MVQTLSNACLWRSSMTWTQWCNSCQNAQQCAPYTFCMLLACLKRKHTEPIVHAPAVLVCRTSFSLHPCCHTRHVRKGSVDIAMCCAGSGLHSMLLLPCRSIQSSESSTFTSLAARSLSACLKTRMCSGGCFSPGYLKTGPCLATPPPKANIPKVRSETAWKESP